MRSWLFVPGDSERKLAKAFDTEADIIILDLEDSVAPARKHIARGLVREAAKDAPAPVAIRINPLTGEDAQRDIDAIIDAAPTSIVLPKSEGGADVTHLGHRLSVAEAEEGLSDGAVTIMAIATETAAAVFGLGSYMNASTRLTAMTWGSEDLSTALSATRTRTPEGALTGPYALARSLCLLGAHAAGVAPIDTVFTTLNDEAGLHQECLDAAADGFFGKLAIHPAQVPIINETFTPTPKALAHAEDVVSAFAAAPDAGVLAVGGKMVDRPHLKNAEQVIARASAIKARTNRHPTDG
ncbi:MAG: CoA ester lyase [Pseudomonadota bacterium]